MSELNGAETMQPADLRAVLEAKVETWRDKLLDLGNRNGLINTRISDRSSTIEFDRPDAEAVWRMLAAESEAGADPMRFPWRRDLVPPPEDWQEYEDLPEEAPDAGTTATPSKQVGTKPPPTIRRRKRREWNPPLSECRDSPHLQPNDLLVDRTDKVLDRKLRALRSDADLAMSEQGVHALYAVFGFLRWYESADSAEERLSPLMLVPVTLSRDSSSAPWELTEAEDDAIDNLCLRQRLRQDFNLELPPLPEINELEESGARLAFLEAVRAAVEKHDRWEVLDKAVMGRFAFPKIAMWKDLGEHRESVLDHPLCRAIAGDEAPTGTDCFGPVGEVPSAAELDDAVVPGEVKTILDCDSSQLEAIVAARKGVSFVLDGPPGTGKSQTIANIIADALSVGRTVLFVSEKISALEVVRQRLADRGLDDFCLECHSDKANRKAVLFELERCLNLPGEVYDDAAPKLEELSEQRSRLNDYVRRIHQPREPLGFSAFELFGRVSRLTSRGLAQRTRCKLPDLTTADRAAFDGWMRLLTRAADVEAVLKEHDTHPWRGCRQSVRSLSIHDDVRHHFTTLADRLSEVADLFEPLTSRELVPPVTVANVGDALKACRTALSVPDAPAAWFDAPAETAAAAVAQLTAEARRDALRGELTAFTEAAEDAFPLDAARAAAAPTSDETPAAVHGLREPSDPDLRGRLAETAAEADRLAPAAAAFDKLRVAFDEAIDAGVPALPQAATLEHAASLADAVALAANVGPAPAAWLDPKRRKSVRSLAEKAATLLDRNDALTDALGDRIAADQLAALAEECDRGDHSPDILDAAEGLTDRGRVAAAARTAADAEHLLSATGAAAGDVAAALGINPAAAVPPPYGVPAERLAETLAEVERAGVWCGSWKAPAVRDRLRRAAEEAVGDLQDADAVRGTLSDRLSHRAFRESAAGTADRGTVYASAMKRLVGGFGAFRAEAAELYSGELPKGAALAADMATLQKFHRRRRDVRDAAEELAPHLPEGFLPEEPSAWQKLGEAAAAIDRLAADWPDAAANLPDGPRTATPGGLTAPATRFTDAAAAYGRLAEDPASGVPPLAGGDPAALADDLSARRAELETYAGLWDRCNEFTLRPVESLDELRELLSAAETRRRRTADLTAAAEKYADWLPPTIDPASAAAWRTTLAGVEAAERFDAAGLDAEALRAVWCDDGFTARRDMWAAAGRGLSDAVDSAHEALAASDLTAAGSVLQIADTLRAAAARLSGRRGQLAAVAAMLREDADVPVADLPAAADRFGELRDARPAAEQAASCLADLGVPPVAPADLPAATWLAETVAAGPLDLLQEAVAADAATRREVKAALLGGKTALSDAGFKESWNFLKTVFDPKEDVSDGFVVADTPVGELAEKLRGLLPQTARFDEWLRFSGWRRDVSAAGFGTVVEELIEGRYEPADAADVVAVQFYRQLFDRLAETDRPLGEFDVEEHERIRRRFRFLDQWEVRAAAGRIRQYQLGRSDRPVGGFFGADSSELGILQKEAAKKRKHKPLRRLFAEIPTVLQRLKPCVMMSPLSVSTFLDTDDIRFDLVIFDEASQVFPWDAMGAVYRGRQLIVAGDDKQLPPTNFFNRADAETDDEADIGDYESILSLCKSIGMPNQRLKWHYRSRREPLIAFSNRHFYDGDLVTFPSVHADGGVRLEHVPEGRWIERRNRAEADRVVAMIVDHVRSRPDTSLGVIALNQSQQRCIEDTLYDLRRDRPEIDALFDGGNYFGTAEERLFVKNLENVQGDERDVIFLSMGYGFSDAGKFSKNFGPINKQHGERRLNVAVTRAREELVFVSSVRAADMDLSGSRSDGAHLLKAYLNYAERGVDTLGTAMQEFAGEAESPFEEEVANALLRKGLVPVPQVGCGGFRIDLALKHPDRPGEFALAVECDGASYHSSHTARDRDRIRQTVLENLGWRVVRIWSTDWVRDPDRQIDRVLLEYDAALSAAPPPHADPEEPDEEDAEPQPQFVEKPSAPTPVRVHAGNIDDVPDRAIGQTAVYVLTQAGAMSFEDLVRQTSRELGFGRLGHRIRARIEDRLSADLAAGTLKRLGERITLVAETNGSTVAAEPVTLGDAFR